eukprot:TRINITY_DN20518_c0_g1_i1.p1 TRINITY_DN20518_c0_g1~~TRINITY_DN20518_c0_g1_i1.p1  ORF type:complete len:1014 (-),score=268.59 TRINITY_DN20518_c0_g1_i1:62-3103(-)
MRRCINRCLCGPFLGHFEDIHKSPPNSDDEDEADSDKDALLKPKHHNKATRQSSQMKKKKMEATGLLPYLTTVEVEQHEGTEVVKYMEEAVKAQHVKFAPEVLTKLCQYVKLHTVDLTHCHLTEVPPKLYELENMVVLRLSHNNLTVIKHDPNQEAVGKAAPVEEMVMEWNKISHVQPKSMEGEIVKSLVLLSFAHNEIRFLPRAFLAGAKRLRYLDMSFNSLTSLPDSIYSCHSLQMLILSRNQLSALPDNIGKLKDLRKLFVSYNRLTGLPSDIGACEKLQKIRVTSNRIRHMPDSLIDLWQHRGGRLRELMVSDNPLVQPSITAFEMGGLDQALEMFEMWVMEQADLKEQALRDEEAQLMLENNSTALAMKDVDPEAAGAAQPLLAIADGGVAGAHGNMNVAAVPTSQPMAPGDANAPGPPPASGPDKDNRLSQTSAATGNTAASEDVQQADSTHGHHKNHAYAYYFSHESVNYDPAKIAEIRSAECTLLLLKKSHFVARQKKAAEAQIKDGKVPPHLQKFVSPDFKVMQYNGPVLVSDVDLFFNLLVYSTKPMFSSGQALFDKFSASEDPNPYLTHEEWSNFCVRVPLKLPEDIQDQMWELMAYQESDKLYRTDFVAAWHIHDIEDTDSWIKRVSALLKLEYYDMSLQELRLRLQAKGAADATPQLDFDGNLNDEEELPGGRESQIPELPLPTEGERWLEGRHVVSEDAVEEAEEEEEGKEGHTLISLDNGQVQTKLRQWRREDDEQAEQSDDSLLSHELSQASDSSEDDFDAQEILEGILEAQMWEEEQTRLEQVNSKKMQIQSDADIASLMTMPVDSILEAQARVHKPGGAERKSRKMKRQKTRLEKLKNKKELRDGRFKTDVFTVRQSMREAYRNIPHDDFSKFVNFVLRGLKFIRHYNPAQRITYWHAEDPTFKTTVSMNKYTEMLLKQMGFVCVQNTYWVWPEKHLNYSADSVAASSVWGNRIVPPDCPGSIKGRLDDMLYLLRLYQRVLLRDGKAKFTGHLKS